MAVEWKFLEEKNFCNNFNFKFLQVLNVCIESNPETTEVRERKYERGEGGGGGGGRAAARGTKSCWTDFSVEHRKWSNQQNRTFRPQTSFRLCKLIRVLCLEFSRSRTSSKDSSGYINVPRFLLSLIPFFGGWSYQWSKSFRKKVSGWNSPFSENWISKFWVFARIKQNLLIHFFVLESWSGKHVYRLNLAPKTSIFVFRRVFQMSLNELSVCHLRSGSVVMSSVAKVLQACIYKSVKQVRPVDPEMLWIVGQHCSSSELEASWQFRG